MRRQGSETDHNTSRYNHSQSQEFNHGVQPAQTPQYSQVQEVSVKPFHTPYAPSPSLLGANDPLGRTVARIPVFSFGFGGKFVTCFHGGTSLMTGFDVALSSRNSTGVHIRVLKTIVPESALNASATPFPGPLFSDLGAATSLVRTGASTQTKTKKASVIKYLSERADEIAMGLPYLKPDSTEGHQIEGKLALVKLLKVMVESDGRLTGTSQIDNAVRVALVPRLERSADSKRPLVTVEGYTSDLPPNLYPTIAGVSNHMNESPISVTTLRPSALNIIQDFLLRGERRQAYHFALDEKLWAHAMVIASSIDKEAWKEVVNEFLRTELNINSTSPVNQNSDGQALVNGYESLRVAYSLFSGQGAAAVQELIPQNILSRTTARLQPALIPHMTPRTPNFGLPTTATTIPTKTLSHWAETVAIMVSNQPSPETSAALTAMGDQLVTNHMYEAAHVCYLLAPQTSPLGGIGNPAARIVLVGSRSPQSLPSFAKDVDSIIFSEIVEFALSLTPTSRSQDNFQGIPHLQAYKFIRAMGLAEIGEITLASRYCEAITSTISRGSPYFTPVLVDQLKGLSDRIGGIAHVDKMGSWMGAKLSKPSLDTIGGWLENRFTKIVTGDADTGTPPEEKSLKAEDRSFSGPFAHYSTISSTTPSARSSPQPSFVNLNMLPPHRSGSAMASSSPYNHPQIDRASSAMDYVKRKPSPGPRISSAGAVTTTFAGAPSFGQDSMATARPSLHTEDDNPTQEATWWGSNPYDGNSTTQTPTASTFLRVDEGALTPSSDGFISLMDNDVYSIASKSPANSSSQHPVDDEEDLGFGNTKSDKLTNEDNSNKAPITSPPKDTAPPPTGTNDSFFAASVPSTNGSWISRWWKKSDSAAPGPIKASLGEESAFYYDKEQKRWINKKAGGNDLPKPSIPPPPSRAQTTSPGAAHQRSSGTSDTGPPPRSASAIDLSTSPPSRTVMRVRSNLVPTPESAPSTPTGTRLGPPGPPPGRPKSQASKRSVRSRYVDVLQQEIGT
ncbi:Sec23-binding domain of Sec16-domain-containing protein [Collybia nuda]|uniref:Protein transport protein sec16 n=1 Tax=Collybia nuda TaxID=64659 RepID=A0A9P5YBN2_9AGAR|nr:Sec23-binding domain of Sec16-domain-containing protein [Collybia nuda]